VSFFRFHAKMLLCVPFVLFALYSKAQKKTSNLAILNCYYLVDSTGQLTIDNVLQPAESIFFKEGYVKSSKFTVWMKIRIPASMPTGEYGITVRADHADLFFRKENCWQVVKAGIQLLPSQRNPEWDVFHLCFPHNSTEQIVYLRLEDFIGWIPVFEPKSKVINAIALDKQLFLLISGGVFFLILINVALYLFLRKGSFLRFALFQLCFYVTLNKSRLTGLIGDDVARVFFLHEVHNVLFIVSPLSLLYFTMSYFQLLKRSPHWLKGFYLLMALSAVCFFTLPFHIINAYVIIAFNLLVYSVLLIYSSIALFRYKFKPALYILICMLIVLAVSIFYPIALYRLSAFDNVIALSNLSLFLFGFILSLGMAERFGQLNQEVIGRRLIEQKSYYEKKLLEKRNDELKIELKLISDQKLQIESQNKLIIEANDKIRLQAQDLERKNSKLSSLIQSLRTTQNQLIHSEKMAYLGELTAGIAHEINNPLNFISGGIQALSKLQEDFVDNRSLDLKFRNTEIKELMAAIRNGVDRAERIVRSLRLFSDGKSEALYTSTELKEYLENTLIILKSKIDAHAVKIVTHYQDNLLIGGNISDISQVIINILDNAIDSLVDSVNPTITITTTSEKDKLLIRIMDNGIGIAKEIRSRIMEPFFTTKEVGKGKGLGLAISYGIIQKHNGTLSFNSEVGKGTEFIIALPT
jgi:signal transduction histidine kinase